MKLATFSMLAVLALGTAPALAGTAPAPVTGKQAAAHRSAAPRHRTRIVHHAAAHAQAARAATHR